MSFVQLTDLGGVSDLRPGDAEKVRAGNQCMRSALSIIHWLEKHPIPYIFEHPSTSNAWCLPRLRWLRRLHHVQAVTTDFCQYGVPWRKRTLLLCSRIDEQDLVRCQRLCTGPPGFCATGLRHVQLTGSNKQGVPFTRIAQPYPAKLCHHLAFGKIRTVVLIFGPPSRPHRELHLWDATWEVSEILVIHGGGCICLRHLICHDA